MTLLAFATDRRAAVDMDQKAAAPAAAIVIACPQGPQQQTRLTLQRANGTDRRTPYRYIDPAAYYVSSVNKTKTCSHHRMMNRMQSSAVRS